MPQKEPVCPKCGNPNKKANHLSGREILIYLAVGIAPIWWLASDNSSTSTSVLPEYTDLDARTDCEGFVKKNLKAPSTAEFAPRRDLQISGSGVGPWTVAGYVDSQNSFGAMIRSRFRCTIQYENTMVLLKDIQIE
jgi:hypothetical protein